MNENPLFSIGDKFLCMEDVGKIKKHVCKITKVGKTNVDLVWIKGYGSVAGWTVEEVNHRIETGQWIKHSPITELLYEE